MPTMTELKKLAIGGRGKNSRPFVATYETEDGTRWATNAYWLVRAHRIRTLLEHHNLTDDPGVFDINGKLSRRPETDPPDCSRFLEPKDYDLQLTRTVVEGVGPILTNAGDTLLAVYDRPNGGRVFLNEEFHAWILATVDEPIDYSTRWKRASTYTGAEPMTVRQVSDGPLKAVGFFATRQTRHGGCYRDKEGAPGGREWVPEEWTDGPEELVAVLMPVRNAR